MARRVAATLLLLAARGAAERCEAERAVHAFYYLWSGGRAETLISNKTVSEDDDRSGPSSVAVSKDDARSGPRPQKSSRTDVVSNRVVSEPRNRVAGAAERSRRRREWRWRRWGWGRGAGAVGGGARRRRGGAAWIFRGRDAGTAPRRLTANGSTGIIRCCRTGRPRSARSTSTCTTTRKRGGVDVSPSRRDDARFGGAAPPRLVSRE